MKFCDVRVEEKWDGGEIVKGKGVVGWFGVLGGVEIGEWLVDEGLDEVG